MTDCPPFSAELWEYDLSRPFHLSMEKKEACRKEVIELHQFFEDWATGILPDSDDAFARLTSVLTQDFAIFAPDGHIHSRTKLLEALRSRNGAERSGHYRIWIDNERVRHLSGGLHLVTYEEWQKKDGDVKGRLSTAILTERDGTQNGVAWMHVHETWLPPRGQARDE